MRNLCQPALRSHELAKGLKLIVAVRHSEPRWRGAAFFDYGPEDPSVKRERSAGDGRIFVQDFAIAWPRDPLVAMDVTSGSPLRPVRRDTVPDDDAARGSDCTASARRGRSGCPIDEHDRRARNEVRVA